MKLPKLLLGIILACPVLLNAQSKETKYYDAPWDSLTKHPVPEWFKDAKFGIYAHLGVYCVPAYHSEWYPRYMYYSEEHPVIKHHEETYGKREDFGYKDFIPMFKMENFNAKEWAALYKRAGAKFAGPVAEHHDGFSMWDSKVNRWNAKDMGPKRDVVGELIKALKKEDLKVITSFHHAFNITGYFGKIPGTDSADPAYGDLYGKFENPTEGYDRWLEKIKEVIDAYEPDQIWFDWGLRGIPMEYRRKMASYYYAQEKKWGKEVIITRKLDQLPDGVGVLDFERGGSRDKTPYLWQTDDSNSRNTWSWREGMDLRSTRSVLHELVDIVSKNGVLLLNVCPKADGTISDDQKQMLYEIGDWLEINGEAIYKTRPWRVHGEGANLYGKHGYAMRHSTAPQQNKVNIRYTTREGVLYATCLDWQGDGFTFDKVLVKNQSPSAKASIIGHGEISYKVDGEKLTIDPVKINSGGLKQAYAHVIKLEGFEFAAEPFSTLEVLYLNSDNATPTGDIITRPANHHGSTTVGERDILYHWDNPRDKIYWLVNVKQKGDYYVRGEFSSRFKGARLVLSHKDDELRFKTAPTKQWRPGILKDYGKISFKETGLYRIELRAEDLLEWPGAHLWQIELAPVE